MNREADRLLSVILNNMKDLLLNQTRSRSFATLRLRSGQAAQDDKLFAERL